MGRNILLICTGNTCRSSMAEAIFKDLLDKTNIADYKVNSAGLSAIAGGGAAQQAIQVMKEQGIDLTGHKTRRLSEELVKEADFILTMTRSHKLFILDKYPESSNKIYTLKEYGSKVIDVEEDTWQIEKLYKKIDKKREKFMLEHQEQIKEIEDRRRKLINELEGIEDKIIELERELDELVRGEKREITMLEEKIGNLDIVDPFGQPISIYRECAKEIRVELEKIARKVIEEGQ